MTDENKSPYPYTPEKVEGKSSWQAVEDFKNYWGFLPGLKASQCTKEELYEIAVLAMHGMADEENKKIAKEKILKRLKHVGKRGD